MTAPLGSSAYLDVPAYLRAATNQETASLLGLDTTLAGASATPAGATSLPVARRRIRRVGYRSPLAAGRPL